MNALLKAAAIAAVIAVPAVSFAQPQQSLTRAQVRAELSQLRAAGYQPNDWVNYPQNIQAAEAKVQAQDAASGYGPSMNGTSQSGK